MLAVIATAANIQNVPCGPATSSRRWKVLTAINTEASIYFCQGRSLSPVLGHEQRAVCGGEAAAHPAENPANIRPLQVIVHNPESDGQWPVDTISIYLNIQKLYMPSSPNHIWKLINVCLAGHTMHANCHFATATYTHEISIYS